MSKVYVSLGSNIEREANTRAGIRDLRIHYGALQLSSVYESVAVGFEGDNFYNMVIAFDTDEDVKQVAHTLRDIELNHGRDRNGPKFSSRTLDLDLLLYDDLVMHEPGVQIPRDEILERAFVLWPLAEIAPQLKHPQEHKTYGELWNAFDKSREALKPVAFDFSL